jgi:formate dehydrogenase gamma subunit
MGATTRPSPESAPGPDARLARFDRGERVLHWVNATLFAVMMATATALYVGSVSAVVGRRELVKTIHVWTGLALPWPILLTYALRRWGRGFRADVRRLNRWSAADRRWLRTRGRDAFVVVGKFNAGQKLNAAFTGGAILVMLATGSIMRWPQSFPLAWRTGATFVHDWIYVVLFVTITGHVLMAFNDGESLRAMWRGSVGRGWARRHAPGWYEEMTGEPADGRKPADAAGPAELAGGLEPAESVD